MSNLGADLAGPTGTGGGGGTQVLDRHIFADATARDTYFDPDSPSTGADAGNLSELFPGLPIIVGGVFSMWAAVTPPEGSAGTDPNRYANTNWVADAATLSAAQVRTLFVSNADTEALTTAGQAILNGLIAQRAGGNNVYYVSALGNDANDGLSQDRPLLTFTQAFTLAGASGFVVGVGKFTSTEDFTIPSIATLFGPGVTIAGTVTMSLRSRLIAFSVDIAAQTGLIVDRHVQIDLFDLRGSPAIQFINAGHQRDSVRINRIVGDVTFDASVTGVIRIDATLAFSALGTVPAGVALVGAGLYTETGEKLAGREDSDFVQYDQTEFINGSIPQIVDGIATPTGIIRTDTEYTFDLSAAFPPGSATFGSTTLSQFGDQYRLRNSATNAQSFLFGRPYSETTGSGNLVSPDYDAGRTVSVEETGTEQVTTSSWTRTLPPPMMPGAVTGAQLGFWAQVVGDITGLNWEALEAGEVVATVTNFSDADPNPGSTNPRWVLVPLDNYVDIKGTETYTINVSSTSPITWVSTNTDTDAFVPNFRVQLADLVHADTVVFEPRNPVTDSYYAWRNGTWTVFTPGSIAPPTSTESFYHGLSSANNPDTVALGGLTEQAVGTGAGQQFTFSVGPATLNDYLILLVPADHDISTMVNTGTGFTVIPGTSFTKTTDVRTIGGRSYHSYTLGALVAQFAASYLATLA